MRQANERDPLMTIACARCGLPEPFVQGFQYWEEGYVCCVCLVKQDYEYKKMLSERPWDKMPELW